MTTRFRVVSVCATLTLVCSTAIGQSTARPARSGRPTPIESVDYQDGLAVQDEFVSQEAGGSCAPTTCGGHCGCTVGTAAHVGYPRCFNFRSPCVGGGAPCGCCGSIFGELLCDIRDWGSRMRSYRAASCSTCSACGDAGCSCSCAAIMEPSCEGAFEPSCEGCFEPSCGIGVEKCSWFRMPSFGGLASLFGGCGGCSCGCRSCDSCGTCCGGGPRDAACFGNNWYPTHDGASCPNPAMVPHGGDAVAPPASNIQDAPMEPIPAPQGSTSAAMLPSRGNRKSIHYYSQSSPVQDRHVYSTAQPGVPMNGAQVARAPLNSPQTVPPSALPPLPMTTPEPEVRVREEIPTAPNAIRRMSYTEFGASAKASSSPIGSSGSTIRFADEP